MPVVSVARYHVLSHIGPEAPNGPEHSHFWGGRLSAWCTNPKGNRNLLLEYGHMSWLPKGTLSSQNRLHAVCYGLPANACLFSECLSVWKNWAGSDFHWPSCMLRSSNGILTHRRFLQGLLLPTKKHQRVIHAHVGLSQIHSMIACSVQWPLYYILWFLEKILLLQECLEQLM